MRKITENNSESTIMNSIRIALSETCICFRMQSGNFELKDGRHIISGVKGFSDLFGFRKSDGRIFFLEIKSPSGRIRPEQQRFIDEMKNNGALSGIARSVSDALGIIGVSL